MGDESVFRCAVAAFAGTEGNNVIVRRESITKTTCPCLITAGQAFGKMNGGVDGVVNTFLSSHTPHEYVDQRVKRVIQDECAGELNVGQAVVVRTAHPVVRHLVYVATMRVPEPVPDTLNAYYAFRAALVAALKTGAGTSDDLSVATPLMCTGAGQMPVERACRQMRAAYDSVITGGDVRHSFPEIWAKHRALVRRCSRP